MAWWSVGGMYFQTGLKNQNVCFLFFSFFGRKLVPLIKIWTPVKWPPQKHRLTLTCSTTILSAHRQHASVWKLWLHTGSKDQKVSYFLQIYTHWFCSIILLYWFTPSLFQKVGNLIANIVLFNVLVWQKKKKGKKEKSTTVMASKWTWQHYKLCHTEPHSNKCHIFSFTCFKCIFCTLFS